VKARRRFKHANWNDSQALSLLYAPLPDNTGSAIATRLQRDFLSQIGLQIDIKTTNPGEFRQSLKEASIDLALLSMPLYRDGIASSLAFDQMYLLIPLYFLPASFLCQPNVRGVNIAWGGVIAFESVWLVE
jgi:hypothetical protein